MASPTFPIPNRPIRILILVFLTILLSVGAVPGYLAGKWQWQNPPAVKALGELKKIRKEGIQLPGWKTQEQRSVVLGEHPWSIQQIKDDRNPATSTTASTATEASLFLFTQNGPKDQPQVEWSEINGIQRWKTDSDAEQTFDLKLTDKTIPVTAKVFRAWTSKRTYGVIEWYAWRDGGHPSPSHWFFADRMAQLQGQRQPWVAVAILYPMEPLDDLNKYRDRLTDLAKTAHSQLYDRALKS
jgi:cyanoexosortase B-associated protein